jgi:DNA topoisomerase-3
VVQQTFGMLAEEDLPGPLQHLAPHARKGLAAGYIKPSKRIFDNAKVSDHFAIIPTLQAPRA